MQVVEKTNSTIEPHMAMLDEARVAATVEPALEPALIDPHHHFWDFASHRYLLDELPADTGSGHRIIATVFIWNAFKRLANGASDSEKADLCRETARRFYRL